MEPKHMKFGNRKQAVLLIKKFSQQTTIHGFRHIVGGFRSNWKTWIWRILLCLCLFCAILGIYQFAAHYLAEPTIVVTSYKLYEDGPNIDPLFPQEVRITICRIPPWQKIPKGQHVLSEDLNYLRKYSFAALGYPFDSLTEHEKNFFVYAKTGGDLGKLSNFNAYLNRSRELYALLQKLGTDSLYFIKDQSLNCTYNFGQWKKIPPPYESVITTRGQCCTRLFSESGTSRNDLLHATDQVDYEPEGYIVYVSHPLESSAFLGSKSFVLVPTGFFVGLHILLQLTKREAFYTSWYEQNADCPTLPESIESNTVMQELYTVESCTQRFILYHTEQLRNCSAILGNNNTKKYDQDCTPDDIVIGYKDWVDSDINEEKDRRLYSCRQPCTEYTYDLHWTITKMGGDVHLSQLNYVYQRDQFYLKEYKKRSSYTVLSQIGGFLGLYLGASIVTIIEFVGFLSRLFWYIVGPRRRRRGVICRRRSQKVDPRNLPNLTNNEYSRYNNFMV